jgi:hypothetical protein
VRKFPLGDLVHSDQFSAGLGRFLDKRGRSESGNQIGWGMSNDRGIHYLGLERCCISDEGSGTETGPWQVAQVDRMHGHYKEFVNN